MNPEVTELSSRETKVNNNSKNLYSAYADQELFYYHCPSLSKTESFHSLTVW